MKESKSTDLNSEALTNSITPSSMKSLKNTYTASHLDFHQPADITGLGLNLDVGKFARTLKKSHVDVVYLFTKCHYGHAYCDTPVGYRHPGLKADLFGKLLRACRAENIGVIAYVSGAMNTHAVVEHPDWAPRERNGQPYPKSAFECVCLISPYTDEVLIPHLAEVTRNYDMDAIMVDTMSIFAPCYCSHCQRLFRADTGQDLPKKNTEKSWAAFARWRQNKCEEFISKICRTVHQIKPDLPVNLNYMYSARYPMPVKHGMGYLTADVSAGLSRLDLLCRYYAGIGLPFEVMTVRFLHGYADWTIKPVRMMQQEMAVIAANGGRCLLIDRPLPDGSLDEVYYKHLKSVFGFIHDRKAVLEEARPVEQIAVLNSAASALGPDMEYFGEAERMPYPPVCGAARMLAESTRHFTLINEHYLSESINKYEAVILPEQYYLDSKTIDLLRSYVKNGGALLASHRSGFNKGAWELSDLFGLDFVEDMDSEYMYLRLNAKDKSEFADLPILIHGKSAKFMPKGCKVLGGLYGPTLDKRFGWGTPPADFGWGVAPSRQTAAGPGVTLHKYGKGRAIYVAGPIFDSLEKFYNPAVSYLVDKLLDLLVPGPLLAVECENGVEVTLSRQPGNRINVHLINLNGEKKVGDWVVSESINPTGGIRVKLRAPARPVAVTRIPENEKMKFGYSDGIVALDIPKLDIHTCIQLKFEKALNLHR